MEERTIRDLELEKILERVRTHALSSEGRDRIAPALFTPDAGVLEERIRYIKRITLIIRERGTATLIPFPDISTILHRKIDSLGLSKREIRDFGEYALSYEAALTFLGEKAGVASEKIITLGREILAATDERGELRDDHPRVMPIIETLERLKKERTLMSEKFISSHRVDVQNEIPVWRGGRVFIQMKSDINKSGIYVAGYSNTGQTLYAEPFPLVELNNRVLLTEDEVERTKSKILFLFSERIRKLLFFLSEVSSWVSVFDFHYSFAVHINQNNWRDAGIGDEIKLIDARHPLLGSKVVPLSIKLSRNVKAVIFSGPNGGGKTVSMKTLGAMVSLRQIAGFAPVGEGSSFPLFSSVLTDIGDGQSIEKEASTFSSHMRNIANITQKADRKSLILLDELGSGTDPEEGSALSLSILRFLSKRSRLTLITSHYNKVKALAYSSSEMTNASMEYDKKANLPVYRIIEGLPGESHAIEAAERYGIPSGIIDEARSSLEGASGSLSGLIESLEEAKRRQSVIELTLIERENAVDERAKRLRAEEEKLSLERAEVEGLLQRKLDAFIHEKRSEIERITSEINRTDEEQVKREKEVRRLIDEAEAQGERILQDKKKRRRSKRKASKEHFKVGDSVSYMSAHGTVIEEGEEEVLVLFEGGLRMRLEASLLRHSGKIKEHKTSYSYDGLKREAKFILDLRGFTLEEALLALDDQIEAALLAGLREFSIIHGLGNGVLMIGIHKYLKGREDIKSYRYADEGDGGKGKTYVTLDF